MRGEKGVRFRDERGKEGEWRSLLQKIKESWMELKMKRRGVEKEWKDKYE